MKIYVPTFLRKKTRASHPGHLQAKSSLDSKSSAPSSSLRNASSDVSWRNGALHCTMDEIVILEETTGRVESGVVLKASLPLPPNINSDLEEAFLRFDINGDGKISASELGSVLRSLGDNPSDEELTLMVKEVDRDGDGFINLQEFVLLNSVASSFENEDLRNAFLVFDADEDGKISAEELYQVLSRLGEPCTLEECSGMIQGVDRDGDGYVDFQEFCTMMTLH